MRHITLILLIMAIAIVTPAQSYHRNKYRELHDRPATYHAHTRGYKNVRFIERLKQTKQYSKHRRNIRRGERKLKPSPLYFTKSN
jgi:hypothetical protein